MDLDLGATVPYILFLDFHTHTHTVNSRGLLEVANAKKSVY